MKYNIKFSIFATLLLIVALHSVFNQNTFQHVSCGFVDSIVTSIYDALNGALDFILLCIETTYGFICDVVNTIYETICLVFGWIWSIIQWVQKEIMAGLYSVLRTTLAEFNVQIPNDVPEGVSYWYGVINNFFPLDQLLICMQLYIETWLAVVFLKMSMKMKMKFGGFFLKNIFKQG